MNLNALSKPLPLEKMDCRWIVDGLLVGDGWMSVCAVLVNKCHMSFSVSTLLRSRHVVYGYCNCEPHNLLFKTLPCPDDLD